MIWRYLRDRRSLGAVYGVAWGLTLSFIVTGASGARAQASEFDPGFIINDADLIARNTMSQNSIQLFIEHMGGYIKNLLVTPDGSSERILASEHIYRTAQKHGINPKFLLVMLQKEQSLIEDPNPKPTQLDWAMGYGCFDGQPCNERWRGFHKQVNSAAEQFRYYYEHINEYPIQPNKAVVIDGETVVPKNTVTAGLYLYTPHLHGNRLFYTLWNKYFSQVVPDGTLVQVPGEPGVWLIQNGIRRAFTSKLALVTRYDPELVVPITQSDLDQYSRGFDIAYPAYSLLKSAEAGVVYLLTADAKRKIDSDEVFRKLGFNPEEVEIVDGARLSEIPNGKDITYGDAYPTGAILKDQKTGDLFYIEAGRRYEILGEALLSINFPSVSVTTVATDLITKYPSGLPVRIKDGTLVKGSAAEVYVISNGMKRHIDSEESFNAVGYKWSNIRVVSDALLDLHAIGEPITAH